MMSIYPLAAHVKFAGYEIVASNWRKFGGWSFLLTRMPNGQLVKYKLKGAL